MPPPALPATLGKAPAGRGNNSPDPAGQDKAGLTFSPSTLEHPRSAGVVGIATPPSAKKREWPSEKERSRNRALKKKVRFAPDPNVSSHRETKPTSVGMCRVIRQGRVRRVGDDRTPAVHRMLRVCSAVRHRCLTMPSYSMRSEYRLNPDPSASALRASVLEGKRGPSPHHTLVRDGVQWSPHYALMHGPSTDPNSKIPQLLGPLLYCDLSDSPQDTSTRGERDASLSARKASADTRLRADEKIGAALTASRPSERKKPRNPRDLDTLPESVVNEDPEGVCPNPSPKPNPDLLAITTDGSGKGIILSTTEDDEGSGGQTRKDGRHPATLNAGAAPHPTTVGIGLATKPKRSPSTGGPSTPMGKTRCPPERHRASGVEPSGIMDKGVVTNLPPDPWSPSATNAEGLSRGPTEGPRCPPDSSGVEPSGTVGSKGDMQISRTLIRTKVESQLRELRKSHSIPLVTEAACCPPTRIHSF